MPETTLMSGTSSEGVPSFQFKRPNRTEIIRSVIAIAVLVGIVLTAQWLQSAPNRGASASFSLLVGAALGIVFERGRFCFFCIMRDYIKYNNSGPMFSILTALAVGSIGYTIIFGIFLPNAGVGRLPPNAHIGPVSWVLAGAGLIFGLGMALSGACISGHLYRLGQGYSRAPLALLGAMIGFGLGFWSWHTLYVSVISYAEVLWLPSMLGYGGALMLQLGVLALLGLIFLRRLPPLPAQSGGQLTLGRLYHILFIERWHPLVSGALVGLIGIFAYLRVEPLGVTAQLGSLSRTAMTEYGWLGSGRLPGLDTFSGCATMVITTITDNGLLISGLALAALAMALLGNRFQLSPLTVRNSFTALLGGVLMGLGSMLALGCTVGTLLSGISAFAVSGWVFAGTVMIGVWLGIRLKLDTL